MRAETPARQIGRDLFAQLLFGTQQRLAMLGQQHAEDMLSPEFLRVLDGDALGLVGRLLARDGNWLLSDEDPGEGRGNVGWVVIIRARL